MVDWARPKRFSGPLVLRTNKEYRQWFGKDETITVSRVSGAEDSNIKVFYEDGSKEGVIGLDWLAVSRQQMERIRRMLKKDVLYHLTR